MSFYLPIFSFDRLLLCRVLRSESATPEASNPEHNEILLRPRQPERKRIGVCQNNWNIIQKHRKISQQTLEKTVNLSKNFTHARADHSE